MSSYSFLYAHTQSSMQFILKVDRIGTKTEIRGLAVGHDRITRLELPVRDYISLAALPLRIPLQPDTGAEVPDARATDVPAKLQAVFVSPERVSDLASLLQINIIQRLIPSLQKEGYEEKQQTPDDRAGRVEDAERSGREPRIPPPARPYPFDDPLAAPPRRPVPVGEFAPPGFEDEFEMNQPPRGGGLRMPGAGRSPFGIGHDDLYPPGLGPQDPFRGSFVPGGGMGGGMHPTLDDPLFQGPHGGGGDEGFDGQVPPGARWDPVGPGLRGPRSGGGFGPGGGNGGFGPGGRNYFGGDII